MTVPTNLSTTLTAVGNKEDLEDVIYRVAPDKTPLVSMIGKGKATARYHEWQTEALDAVDPTNSMLEGDDVGDLDAPNNTARIGNYNQIFHKKFGVSRTQEVVDSAGRSSDLNRQKVLKGIAIRRDAEARFIGNYASVVQSGGTTRKSAGLLAFITTNVSRGSGGSNGGFSNGIVAAATPGTQRTFTETLVSSGLATGFSNGAEPSVAIMSGPHKQQFARFTGVADVRMEVKGRNQATIVAGAEYYVSDFGALALIPHQYGLTRDCVMVDPNLAEVSTLDGFKTEDLGKTGDSKRKLMTHEATLTCKNEAGHILIADLI